MEGKRTAATEKRGKAAWIIAAALAGVLTGAVLGLGLYANGYENVFPGVQAGETDLSGMSRLELERTAESDLLLAGDISIEADGELLGTWTQTELGARIDSEALVEDAWAVGREKGALGWLKNCWTMLRGQLGGRTALDTPFLGYEEEAIRQAAAQMAEKFDRAPVDGAYELTRDGLFATKPASGRALDQEALVQALSAMDGEAGTVEARWSSLPAQALDLDAMAEEFSASGTPARYDVELGRVVDGQPGIALDQEAAAFVLAAAAEGETVRLPGEAVYPEMTAQELEAVLFRDLLGEATTNVSGTSVRRGNVKLSGKMIDGTILNDGDIFDYNEVVGERTTARGFGAAASYVNGETVDTVGGGICQTSSTLYLAALMSNLEIVERYNHRFWPGYITLGMDATVSWGGPEFRFKNDTGYPIRIEASYTNSRLTVKIYGTKTDDTYVKMTHETLSSTSYETQYEETAELPVGVEKQKQNGYTGYEVVTYRNVYDGSGTLISCTEEARSSYKSRDQIILRGTAGAPAGTEGQNPGQEDSPPANDSGINVTPPPAEDGEPELPPE